MRKLFFVLSLLFIACSTEETPDQEPTEYHVTIKDKCDTDTGITLESYCISEITFKQIEEIRANIPPGAPKSPCEKNPLLEFTDLQGNEFSGYFKSLKSGPGVCG